MSVTAIIVAAGSGSRMGGELPRVVALGAEPVRPPGVELGDLARTHRDLVLAEDQPQPAGEDVQPLVALVDAQLAVALGCAPSRATESAAPAS